MVYNFNRAIYRDGGGIEYARAYRAEILRNIGQEARFVYTDMISEENIQHITSSYGFLDSEIIWLYTFFSDCRIAPVTYTLSELEKSFGNRSFTFSRNDKVAKYVFPEISGLYLLVHMVDKTSDYVYRVEIISGGCLLRRDYFTYCRIYTEYFAPLNQHAHLYQRRFFNEDGTVAYEEITDNGMTMYRFPNKMLYSKEELIGYMMSQLELTERDIILIDSMAGLGQGVLQNALPAKVGFVIHSEHSGLDNVSGYKLMEYYSYAFSKHKYINFFITATLAQRCLLIEQFQEYMGKTPKVFAIPPGSLDRLRLPAGDRKKYSLITASRFVKEKNINWIIEAVVMAKERVPDLSLDIYGCGPEEQRLNDLIEKMQCGAYVHLCGHRELKEIYQNYEVYISGSLEESFGLTLMEAVGSGLPMIGFDVRYGNQNFIDDGKNGYKIEVNNRMVKKEYVEKLSEAIVRLFEEADSEEFCQHSYEKARSYLFGEVEKQWIELFDQLGTEASGQ